MKNTTCAFFDVDGTLINFNSMLSFLSYALIAYYGNDRGTLLLNSYYNLVQDIDKTNNRQALNRLYYRNFKGMEQSSVQELSKKWFEEILSSKDIFNRKCLARLKQHQNNHHCVAFISGGFFGTLKPLAEHLHVKHVLCVQPIIDHGVLTGEIDPLLQTIGIGKAIAIKKFMKKQYSLSNHGKLSSCYAYGDHISDIEMLTIVDNPVVVGNDKDLLEYATVKKWCVLS